MIKLITIFLISFNFVSCAIPRPRGLICIYHLADPDHGVGQSYNHCYDMEKDFDNQGNRIPGHDGIKVPVAIDKHINMDPDSFANLNAYWRKLYERYKDCK